MANTIQMLKAKALAAASGFEIVRELGDFGNGQGMVGLPFRQRPRQFHTGIAATVVVVQLLAELVDFSLQGGSFGQGIQYVLAQRKRS